jgi:DNA invertase Pin-like site-specific DNA recombinase
MRVGIYARVSTLIGQSPEMQLTELREYASRRGWEIFSEYVDSGISGSKESRPELNRLMSDLSLADRFANPDSTKKPAIIIAGLPDVIICSQR